jgi:hypothetical protein
MKRTSRRTGRATGFEERLSLIVQAGALGDAGLFDVALGPRTIPLRTPEFASAPSAPFLLLQFNGLARTVGRQFAVATVRIISDRPPVGCREAIEQDWILVWVRTLRTVRTVAPPAQAISPWPCLAAQRLVS